MATGTNIRSTFQALVESGNIVYGTSPDTAVTPASGAPGAVKVLMADAAALWPWWFCGLIVGNLSGAGATRFNYGVHRLAAGTGTMIATETLLLEAATATVVKQLLVPFPVKVAAGVGASVNQLTDSGKTLDVAMIYARNVGA